MFKSGDLIVQFVAQNVTYSMHGIILCRPFAVRCRTDDMMICVGEASNVWNKVTRLPFTFTNGITIFGPAKLRNIISIQGKH